MAEKQHYECDVCRDMLTTVVQLIDHLESKHGEIVPVCAIPPHTTTTTTASKAAAAAAPARRSRSSQASSSSFVCEECSRTLPSKAKLLGHLKSMHGYDARELKAESKDDGDVYDDKEEDEDDDDDDEDETSTTRKRAKV